MSVKLNLGCGSIYLEGFENLDYDKNSLADKQLDLNHKPYPYEDDSVDFIYASNVVEHLSDMRLFFRECHRILKPGGRLHIKCPHIVGVGYFTHPEHINPNACNFRFPLHLTENNSGENWFNRDKETVRYFLVEDMKFRYGSEEDQKFYERIISFLANLNIRLCERVWCGWVGGFNQIEYKLVKKKEK